jgi:hypothetical protein
MGWRFRKSFKIIPGVRLNLSRSGLSASIGGAPLTLNISQRGLAGTASVPGTGISYRQDLGVGPRNGKAVAPGDADAAVPVLPAPVTPLRQSSATIEEIRSASTELLTSESLKEIKRLMQMTYEEHEDISRQLDRLRPEQERGLARYEAWQRGFLLRRLFRNAFARRKSESETAAANVGELEEQLRLTTIAAQIDIEKDQAEPYFRMRDDFAALCECAAIWDIQTRQQTDKIHERTTADMVVGRQRVTFSVDICDLITWDKKVPRFQNANGGDIYLYPGFILYRAAKAAFSVIDYHDVKITPSGVGFQEEETVPSDATVIGQTWKKSNKDGSRDKRFTNNYQIPVVRYGGLALKSGTGLWEEFLLSNPDRLERFVNSFEAFVASFASTSHNSTVH